MREKLSLIQMLLQNKFNFTYANTGQKLNNAQLASAIGLLCQLEIFVENAQKHIAQNQKAVS